MTRAAADHAGGPLWRKLAWFAGLWAVGVATLAVVAYGIKALIGT